LAEKKESSIIIKRENWKGRYRIVARDRGRLASHRKWGTFYEKIDDRKEKMFFSIRAARILYKANKTFNIGVFKETWSSTGTREYVDLREKPRKPYGRAEKVQYVVKGILPDGKIITARSEQHDLSFPKSEMKEEAYNNFYRRLADSQNLNYDIAEGKDVFDKIGNIDVKEGYVYYVFK